MTDDMDADDTAELIVDPAANNAPTRDDLKRHIATWAKRWTLGMVLSVAVALILERARLLPLLTSIFALISLIVLLIRHGIAARKSRQK